MKFRCKIVFIMIFLQCLYIKQVMASEFHAIVVPVNRKNQATIMIDCSVVPIYMAFFLHNPERIVIDFFQNHSVQKNLLPINFSNNNLIKCVRMSTPVKPQGVRIVIDLAYSSMMEVVIHKKIKKNYRLIFTFCKKKTFVTSNTCVRISPSITYPKTRIIDINHELNNNIVNITEHAQCNNNQKSKKGKKLSRIVVAIDAGHGGQDPGATGYNGIYEKNITISIARKLQKLLDLDPMFSAVMVRDGDYFLSVMERSDIARRKEANVLISIHVDSAMDTKVRGASVWILSNRRAKSEMVYLLNRRDKCIGLLGGIGKVLKNYRNDPYFNHFILDLQFGYFQKVGYNIATHVLKKLKNISLLHKDSPEYSSFGVLRALDIPSILVEIGFISNQKEAYLLSNNGYQEKIAEALYQGLHTYFITKQSKKRIHNYSKIKNAYIVTTS